MKAESPLHPRCGLPVVRINIDEERDEWVRVVEVCGEQLHLESTTSEWIDNEGPTGPDYAVWKLTCLGGHVLLVPDDQGNEQEVPFHWDEAMKAIAPLLVFDGTPACWRPSPDWTRACMFDLGHDGRCGWEYSNYQQCSGWTTPLGKDDHARVVTEKRKG